LITQDKNERLINRIKLWNIMNYTKFPCYFGKININSALGLCSTPTEIQTGKKNYRDGPEEFSSIP
jgi:hypothetical protein